MVLDASVALAWFFHDEATPATASLLDRLQRGRALVPAIWLYEVTNGLVVGLRRRRTTADRVTAFLGGLDALPIEVQGPVATFAAGCQPIAALAESLGITAYDAAYLELCQRLDLPLATLDGEGRRTGLKQAAAALGVRLVRPD